ncbi:hypothetical protein BUALT_Bualt15G0034000 [Buddleja alternifolia]|uniref:Phytocyanin domain-containing protein n=1 Tax=Buddleja alternifolia TaxID=168488 RepID=A0AAV6WK10_9LAMI|nr:hypothetical protein BUALT_Bualt15G0034000 [Buddleja alternifolia]
MSVKCAALVLLVAISMFGIAVGNKNWSTTAGNWNFTNNNYWGYWHNNATKGPNTFIVGGSEKWRFGYNYTEWAIKNGPFYLNDKLVFKYDPPNGTTFPHSVYLLPNFWSFQNCDLRRAKKIGEVTSGAGKGFEFVLKRWQPYFFACGERNGIHCKTGLMKFAVWPLIRWTTTNI